MDVSYLGGIGAKQANFAEISTTQGYNYNNLFFVGVGARIDQLLTNSYWYYPCRSNTINLSSLGASLSFEW